MDSRDDSPPRGPGWAQSPMIPQAPVASAQSKEHDISADSLDRDALLSAEQRHHAIDVDDPPHASDSGTAALHHHQGAQPRNSAGAPPGLPRTPLCSRPSQHSPVRPGQPGRSPPRHFSVRNPSQNPLALDNVRYRNDGGPQTVPQSPSEREAIVLTPPPKVGDIDPSQLPASFSSDRLLLWRLCVALVVLFVVQLVFAWAAYVIPLFFAIAGGAISGLAVHKLWEEQTILLDTIIFGPADFGTYFFWLFVGCAGAEGIAALMGLMAAIFSGGAMKVFAALFVVLALPTIFAAIAAARVTRTLGATIEDLFARRIVAIPPPGPRTYVGRHVAGKERREEDLKQLEEQKRARAEEEAAGTGFQGD